MITLVPTGSQTVGPFFNYALTSNASLGTLHSSDAAERIRVQFELLDGDGAPANGDAMIEIWQADSNGRYDNPGFCGFGRVETNELGICTFDTIRPGPAGEGAAPHIHVIVFGRGLLQHLHTRLYFAGEPANQEDPVLQIVPVERRHTLLAMQREDGIWHMMIRLQGNAADETVFFDL